MPSEAISLGPAASIYPPALAVVIALGRGTEVRLRLLLLVVGAFFTVLVNPHCASRPVVRQVPADFPQFADLRDATPYAARHTFMSCCLRAGISLATVAGWCGTSIQMISETYGRVIRRYGCASPVPLDEQFTAGKVEAMTLLSATQTTPPQQGGPTDGPMARKLPPAKRRKVAV